MVVGQVTCCERMRRSWPAQIFTGSFCDEAPACTASSHTKCAIFDHFSADLLANVALRWTPVRTTLSIPSVNTEYQLINALPMSL